MKKENFFSYIEKSRGRLLDIILNISSLFFITFVFLLTIFPSVVNKPITILIVWAIIIFITLNKSIPANTRTMIIKITNIIGSLFFLFLFIGSWISSQSFLVKIYVVYYDILQTFLNQFFIGILLIPVIPIIFIEALKIILGWLGYLFDKLNANQTIRSVVGGTVVITLCIVLVVASTAGTRSSAGMFGITSYLMPFFGFSLLYLHANFLIKEFVRVFRSKF